MRHIHLLNVEGMPIFRQLQLEEALLRAGEGNWCLINQGTQPAVVMGISGKAEELVDESSRAALGLPLIRRFSGGGTVVVDAQTLFVTFIINSEDIPIDPFPVSIMHWTSDFYAPVFAPRVFALRENDYVLGERKCGGNAQYLSKGRWLHHTSFLWDYSEERMNCLLMPKRKPVYRGQRRHSDFLCKLCVELGLGMHQFALRVASRLSCYFDVLWTTVENASKVLDVPHRKATILEN